MVSGVCENTKSINSIIVDSNSPHIPTSANTSPPRAHCQQSTRVQKSIGVSAEMAFMMPVVKNDFDIYRGQQRTRRASESCDPRLGRVRKVSESRSEGPTSTHGMGSPHRSAPAMHARSSSYCRAPPSRTSRVSLRPSQQESPCRSSTTGSPPAAQNGARPAVEKFHNRLVDKLKRALCKNHDGRADERST